MKGKMRGRLCVLLLLTLTALYLGQYHYIMLKESPVLYQVQMPKGIEFSQVIREEILRGEGEASLEGRAAFWREVPGQILENPGLYRKAEVTLKEVEGDITLLTQSRVQLSEGDRNGCYIDKSTAEKLFGSADVVGNTCIWEDKTYEIRGILREEEGTFLRVPDGETSMNRLTLAAFPGDKSLSPNQVERFLYQWNIEGRITDNAFLGETAQLFLMLLPLQMLCTLWRILRTWWTKLNKRAEIRSFLVLLFGLLGVYICCKILTIPEDMIPDKWSNFSFWKQWWQRENRNILLYLQSEKSRWELNRIGHFLKSGGYFLLSVFFWRQMERSIYKVTTKVAPPPVVSSTRMVP